MALSCCPEGWRLLLDFPDPQDQATALERTWFLPLQEPIAYQGQDFALQGPLKVAARAKRVPQGVEVQLRLEAQAETCCGKCLAPLTVAIEEDFLYCYTLQIEEPGEEIEEFSDSAGVLLPVKQLKGPVDIGSLVWECLVVSLPAFALCPQGCTGLEGYLPKEDQSDPRFQVLAGLLSTSEKEGKNDGNAQDESVSSQNP